MIKAVIFDFDGIVIDSNKKHARSFYQVLRKHGFKIKLEQIYQTIGLTASDILRKLNVPEEEIHELEREKLKTYLKIVRKEGLKRVPGIRKLLNFLRKKGILLAIVSSSRRALIEFGLRKANLQNVFNLILGADEVEEPKPSPKPLLQAAQGLGVKASSCIYVGDSVYEMMAAKKAGMQGIGVSTFYSPEELKAAGAKQAFKNLTDLLAYFKDVLK